MTNKINLLKYKIEQLLIKSKLFKSELEAAFNFLETDPSISMTKSRIITEKILLDIFYTKMGELPKKKMLGEMLVNNQFTKNIERRILSRLHSIRSMCNLGIHGEKVESEDAIDVLDNLCIINEWYIKNYNISTGNTKEPKEDNRINQLLRHATSYFESKKYQQALLSYGQIIGIDEKNADAYCGRAKCYSALEQYKEAIREFDLAESNGKSDYFFYASRGLACLSAKKYKSAISDFTKSIELNVKNKLGYELRAIAYERSKDFKSAIADYNMMFTIDPKDHSIYSKRAKLYYKIAKYTKAIKDFKIALQYDPKSSELHLNIGHSEYLLDNFKAAYISLSKAIELDPKNDFAYRMRAKVAKELSDHDAAVADYKMAIQNDPDYGDYYFELAELMYYNLNSTFPDRNIVKEIIKYYEVAFDKGVTNSDEILYTLGTLHTYTGDLDRGLDLLTRYINKHPENPKGYERRAAVYFKKGDLIKFAKEEWKAKKFTK